MKRTAEDRAAREEAIRLARAVPGGADLLGSTAASTPKPVPRKATPQRRPPRCSTLLDEEPVCVGLYKSVSIWLGENKQGDPKRPVRDRSFRGGSGSRRAGARWCGSSSRTTVPPTPRRVARVPERVRVGMDYREVLRAVGFPGFNMGRCHWDHGFPIVDDCYEYSLDEPKVVREGHMIGAIPPADPTIVHVVIVGGRVAKVTTTRGRPPENDRSAPARRAGVLRVRKEHHRGRRVLARREPGGGGGHPGVRLGPRGERRPRARSCSSPGPRRSTARASCDVAFSPDGKILAAGGTYDASAHVWEVATGRYRGALNSYKVPEGKGRMDCVAALAFSPDGKTLATVGYDRDLRLWDVATGRLHASLRGHQFEVTAVAYVARRPDHRHGR